MEKEAKNSGDVIKEFKELEKIEISTDYPNVAETIGGGFMTLGCC